MKISNVPGQTSLSATACQDISAVDVYTVPESTQTNGKMFSVGTINQTIQ